MENKFQKDELIKLAEQNIGGNLKDNGKLDSILDKLSEEDTQKLARVLGDKQATERLLSSPQAQQLIKMFTKGK